MKLYSTVGATDGEKIWSQAQVILLPTYLEGAWFESKLRY
jgi:hypothetical protein